MKKYLGFVAVLVFLFSCADDTRDNPYDMWAVNYIGNSSAEGSSSSVRTGGEPSSSSIVPSSGSVVQSSSSVLPSSSSVASSSSSSLQSGLMFCMSAAGCVEISAEACIAFGGEVVAFCPASSSSSVVPSSSSYGGLCAGFVEGTEREHFGKMKKQFCDVRDGKKYVYVKIGEQTWMAENLNYAASGSKCGDDGSLSDDNTAYCDTYGRLYNWATAMGFESSCNTSTCSSQINSPHRGICPEGWHIPSDEEWDALVTYAGGSSTAGTKLKAKSGWSSGNFTDEHGFSALPGGSGLFQQQGVFLTNVGNDSYWWSATENTSNGAGRRNMNSYSYSNSNVNGGYSGKSHLHSVRCVRD